MKVVFVGPSLPDAAHFCSASISLRPPAVLGDIPRAIDGGATSICLIDGLFETAPPVRHKEILAALEQGIEVIGASSMGALRAAECAHFGMRGVGWIFEQFRDGRVLDDAEVALLHAPAKLGYTALTVPLINIRASLERLCTLSMLSVDDLREAQERAESIFYKDRSWARLASLLPKRTFCLLRSHYQDQKREDAIEALALVVDQDPDRISQRMPDCKFQP